MNAFISKTILNGLFLAGIFGFPFRCFAASVVNWRRLGLAASRGTPRAIFARCRRAQTVVPVFSVGGMVFRPTESLGIRKLHLPWSHVSESARMEIGGYPSVDFTARSLERYTPSHS